MIFYFFLEKGVSVVYYGEEIGMLDADISYENTMDPWGCNCGPINYVNCSRDPARTPMQWNGAKNAGFSQVRLLKVFKVKKHYSKALTEQEGSNIL